MRRGWVFIATPVQYVLNKSYAVYQLRSSRREVNAQSTWTVSGQSSASDGNLVQTFGLDWRDGSIGTGRDWRAARNANSVSSDCSRREIEC